MNAFTERKIAMRLVIPSMIAAMLLFGALAHAAMYTWTDDKGVKHYSNFPQPDTLDAKKIDELKFKEPVEKADNKAALKILKGTAEDKAATGSGIAHKVYDKEFFMGKVRGKTPERVYKFLKRTPDRRDDRKTWVYYDIVNNPAEQQVESVVIKFEQGQGKSEAVDFVFFVNKKS
ncbi:MAG: DUF4124 domain-containing protein [Desulfobacterales bacterium]|nr:DUF4124 domain-containing protein [Desulfobacterales bacterium]